MDSYMTKCPHCLKPIKKSYLVKHIGRFHPDIPKQRVPSIVCSLCENKFRYRQEFRDHVEKAHAKITRTDLKLKNWDEFEIWLKNEESKEQVRFTKGRAPNICSNGNSKLNFYCQYDNSRRKETIPQHERKRALKYKGTQKIKGCCPAEIIVEKCINGTVEVVYFSTHIGHENQLAHFRLSREDRKKLAVKIEDGVPFDRILDDVRNDVSKHAGREHSIDRKTLHNIAAKLKLSNRKRDSDDGHFIENRKIMTSPQVEKNYKKQTFNCDSCEKTFATHFCLLRHKSTVHEVQSSHFICNECDKIFQRKDNLLRHISTHGIGQISTEKLSCETCHRSFDSKSKLRKHEYKQHEIVLDDYVIDQYKCYNCSAEFSGKSNLKRHFRTCRPYEERLGSKIKCLTCGENFRDKRTLAKHYKEVHNIEFKFEYKFFATLDEFDKWLPPSFHREANWKTWIDDVIMFRCHRSGIYVDNCKKNNTERKRRLKASGTKKLQGFCPAEINVRQRLNDGSCSVTYQTVHVGHDINDRKEQLYMRLPGPKSSKSKNEKRKLVQQILRAEPDDLIASDHEDLICENIQEVEVDDQGQENRLDEINITGTCNVTEGAKESFTINVIDDNQTWQVGSFSATSEVVEVKMYLVQRVGTKECDSNAEAEPCADSCDNCKSCIHEYVCSCYDSTVCKYMCKHIHALSLSQLHEQIGESDSSCIKSYESPVISARNSSQLFFNDDDDISKDTKELESVKENIRNTMEEVLSLITPASDPKLVEAFFQNHIQSLPSILEAM